MLRQWPALERCCGLLRLQHQLAVDGIDGHRVPFAQLALQQREREPVGELLLDHAAQRPRAVGRVIAHVAEQLLGLVGERHLHAALGDAGDHEVDLQLDDL